MTSAAVDGNPSASDLGSTRRPAGVRQARHMRPRPPSISDVARFAGVSHQTVSRVLNEHPSVSPRTRTLVTAAMEQLGYRPNTAARALASGQSRVLGVLTLSGNFYGPASTLCGVEAAARDHGYAVTVTNLDTADPGATRDAVERLLALRVAGIVAVLPLVADTEILRPVLDEVPCVVVEGVPDDTGTTVVRVDQENGARLATQHLLDLGHPTVWHVAGPEGWHEARSRRAAWQGTLERAGAEVPPVLVGDWSARSGYEAGLVLARMDHVSAVFAANDQMALGLKRAMRESDRDIPQDLSLVGFDDIPEAAYFSPPLTTVRQNFTEVGRRSLAALLPQIEARERSGGDIVIPAELVVRRSTATHRAVGGRRTPGRPPARRKDPQP